MKNTPPVLSLLEMTGENNIDAKINYMIYRIASGITLEEFELKFIEEIISYIKNIGSDGADIGIYMDFAKMNIVAGNREVARALVERLEEEMSSDLLDPSGDVFSVYRELAILESLSFMKTSAIDFSLELVRFLPRNNDAVKPSLLNLAMTIVDTIHIDRSNFSNTALVLEILEHMGRKKDKDAFRGAIARKMLMRNEVFSTLDLEMVKFAETKLFSLIEDRLERAFTSSSIAIAKASIGRLEKVPALQEEAMEQIKLIKSYFPGKSSRLSLVRDLVLLDVYGKIGMEKEEPELVAIIKESIDRLLADGKNADKMDEIVFLFISSLFSIKMDGVTTASGYIKYSDTILERASEQVRVLSYINMSTSLSRQGMHDLSMECVRKAVKILKKYEQNERESALDELFAPSLSEDYLNSSSEEFVTEMIRLIENLDDQSRERIASEFFMNLSLHAINRKFNIAVSM